MGIEGFRRRIGVSRIVEVSLRFIHRFLQNHPYLSTVLSFFFLLYTLFPYIISFLLYCFPFFAFIAVLLHIFWTSESLDVRDQEQEHDSKLFIKNVGIDANRSPPTSRRRSYRVKHGGWERKGVESPAGISDSSMEETGKEISADILKETLSSAIASAPESFIQDQANNQPFMRSEPSMSDFLAFGGIDSQTHTTNGDCESESESSSEVEEEEEEEEAGEDGDKAVKWTEDDEKNLMELGFSEMERNTRLESLIAKRGGGRKLIPGAVEEDISAMDFEIAKVSIAKHRHFDDPSNFKEVEGLPIPGSAPSVLLPMRNPFHLPHDPIEENPNLAVDGFRREFGAANQKDLSFCRHGSFCFGTSFPFQSHLHEAMSNPFFSTEKWDGLGNSRFRRSSPSDREDHEWLIDEPLLCKGRQMTNAEIQEKSQDSNSDTTSSSSSEKLEEIINGDDESMTSATQSSGVVKDPLYGLTSVPGNGGKMEDCFSFAINAAHHTATYSIASDLQVEVSEIDSPPMTLDGTCSPTDGESYTYDGDIEKDATLGGEEIWESSSDVRRRIENVTNHVNFWAAGERSEDVTSQWNPFAAAIPDPVEEPEPSNISDREMKDKDSVGGGDQSSESDYEEPGAYQDNAGSDRSPERDKISDLIGEGEKSSTYGDNTALSELGISILPNSSTAFDSAMATAMEEKVHSSSSDDNPTSKSLLLPKDTSGDETTPGEFTAAILAGGDEPGVIGSWSSEPKEEENGSNIVKHAAEVENEADLEAPTIVENNAEAASFGTETSIKHGGPEDDEADPDDINGDQSSPFTRVT